MSNPINITIIVNTRDKVVHSDVLTFDELVALAFTPVPTGPTIEITITYRHGPSGNQAGTLLGGSRIKVQDRMVFNVTATDKS